MPIETPFSFPCGTVELNAILHRGDGNAARGVLIVVGGPQYRAGSHRQFVLLARDLAKRGIPVMRFDSHGMGDSGGTLADFTDIDGDIGAAIDAFQERETRLREVVLWGLCDAASAALFYGWRDERVAGMVLLNPWVRTEAGQARAIMRHYYLRRLLSRDFWRKLITGRLAWTTSLRSLFANWTSARADHAGSSAGDRDLGSLPLPERMAEGLARFHGPVLFLLSGDDLTAAEFRDTIGDSRRWQTVLSEPRIRRVDFPDADHTFSRRAWRDEVARETGDWVVHA